MDGIPRGKKGQTWTLDRSRRAECRTKGSTAKLQAEEKRLELFERIDDPQSVRTVHLVPQALRQAFLIGADDAACQSLCFHLSIFGHSTILRSLLLFHLLFSWLDYRHSVLRTILIIIYPAVLLLGTSVGLIPQTFLPPIEVLHARRQTDLGWRRSLDL